MTKSDIIKEAEKNFKEMQGLISKQIFSVGDAEEYAKRYYNIYRSLEQTKKSRDKLIISRDELKEKYLIAKAEIEKMKTEKCIK